MACHPFLVSVVTEKSECECKAALEIFALVKLILEDGGLRKCLGSDRRAMLGSGCCAFPHFGGRDAVGDRSSDRMELRSLSFLDGSGHCVGSRHDGRKERSCNLRVWDGTNPVARKARLPVLRMHEEMEGPGPAPGPHACQVAGNPA